MWIASTISVCPAHFLADFAEVLQGFARFCKFLQHFYFILSFSFYSCLLQHVFLCYFTPTVEDLTGVNDGVVVYV